jgi:hypothetical protein
VKHIYEEDSEGKISKLISPGIATGLMYLMAASATDANAYYTAKKPSETHVDFTRWEKAKEFWAGVGENNEIRQALAAIYGADGEHRPHVREKIAVFVNAWTKTVEDQPLKWSELMPSYSKDEDGIRQLDDSYYLGGLDVGPVDEDDGTKEDDSNDGEEKEKTEKKLTPEERQAKIAAIIEQRKKDKAAKMAEMAEKTEKSTEK